MRGLEGPLPEMAVPLLSHEVAGLDDWSVLLLAICALLQRIIGCDEVVWNGVDQSNGRVVVLDDAGNYPDRDVWRLLIELEDHPVKNHFLSTAPAPYEPVRLNDLLSDRAFRRTRTWAELFRPRGVERQLTIPTLRRGSQAATAWSLNRSGSDFSDEDLATAAALAPLLAALELSATWHQGSEGEPAPGTRGPWVGRPATPSSAPVLPAERSGSLHAASLTARELEVLRLLARGLTADAIGHRLRLSPRTVRKHLEHVYGKLGVHDRLLAVRVAQESGLLPATRL